MINNKFIKTIVTTIAITLSVFVVFSTHTVLPQSNSGVRIVYYLNDPLDDDKGPGTYIYPTNPVFARGVFDLLRLEVEVLERSLLFKIHLSNLGGNPWGGLSGFSLQYIHIYIKTTISEQVDKDTIGLNIRVDPGWHIAILLNGGWGQGPVPDGEIPAIWYYRGDGYREAHVLTPGTEVYVDQASNIIVANLSKNYFIDLDNIDNWMYAVFLTSYDGYGPYRVRPIKAGDPEEWIIGGGDPFAIYAGVEPRVMDVLLRTADEQYRVLKTYDVVNRLPATVYMIYLNKITEVTYTQTITTTHTTTAYVDTTTTETTTVTHTHTQTLTTTDTVTKTETVTHTTTLLTTTTVTTTDTVFTTTTLFETRTVTTTDTVTETLRETETITTTEWLGTITETVTTVVEGTKTITVTEIETQLIYQTTTRVEQEFINTTIVVYTPITEYSTMYRTLTETIRETETRVLTHITTMEKEIVVESPLNIGLLTALILLIGITSFLTIYFAKIKK